MPSNTKICTCQKFCQAPPEGKAIPIRSWHRHAAQRILEEQMTQEERDSQQSRIKKAKRPRGVAVDNDTMIPTHLELDNPTESDVLDPIDQ